jgi:hypothetical protein
MGDQKMKKTLILAIYFFVLTASTSFAVCPYDPECLNNPYSAGSPYKADGINNPYSQYGNPYSNKSANSPYATDAPKKEITVNQTIINAIQQKKLLSLSYDGIAPIVEPHVYGVSKKGNELLRCYQVEGGHNSDKPHEWELLTVSKISSLSDTGRNFSDARPDYKRDDKTMQTIYAQL